MMIVSQSDTKHSRYELRCVHCQRWFTQMPPSIYDAGLTWERVSDIDTDRRQHRRAKWLCPICQTELVLPGRLRVAKPLDVCFVGSCSIRARTLGLCDAHYRRWAQYRFAKAMVT
jgi:hypothetical protein